MRRLCQGVVRRITHKRPGLEGLTVQVGEELRPAVNYPSLTGEAREGDRVILNTMAQDAGLGTGGTDFVVANLDRPLLNVPGQGRGVKLRYSPHQCLVSLVEEDPTTQAAMAACHTLKGMPVVCAGLHSQMGAFVIGLQHLSDAPATVVFVQTDSAALAASFSDLVSFLKEKGHLAAVVTTGQAFGGDSEAVNVYTGLLAACAMHKAEVAVVGPGPGHLGTKSRYGFSSIDLGEAVNASRVLAGRTVVIPRISFGEARQRHLGISHHTATLLGEVIQHRVTVPFPALEGQQIEWLDQQLAASDIGLRHDLAFADGTFIADALAKCGYDLRTMGRDYEEDPAFFQACGAAARVTLAWLRGEEVEYAPRARVKR